MSKNNNGNIKNELSGITTGFKELDDMTSGLQKSDLIILSARPAMGKTAFALSIARNAALKDSATVMYFSLDMSKESLEQRLLAIESNADIIIDDTSSINTLEMKDKCRRLKAKKKLDLIIIDYLELINIEGEPQDSREQEISVIFHELKLLAKEMDCSVLALSTLSRKPEFRTDHRPRLSDMMPEYYGENTDVVIFLYRDEYYNKNTDCPNECEVIVAKQRSGRTGTVKVSWLNKIMRFEDIGDTKETRKEKKYINLNVHSNFTAYETVMTPEEIVEYAVRDGASAVALTDKNSVGGFMRFSRAADKHKDEGFKPIYGVQINCQIEEDSPTLITLLAKTQTGLRNMYKIITAGYMNLGEPDAWPCVSRQIVEENHEGLLIGMDLRWEKLYEADISELEEEFRFADYVGIRPWSEHSAAHNDGRVIGEEQLREAAARMIRLLDELGKCPVAVSSANCITKEDVLCIGILSEALFPAQDTAFAFMKSTAVVLEDYQFLGRELAEKIVIENTNIINETISDDIVVEGGGVTLIDIPDAMVTVENQCNEAMKKRYGSSPSEIIRRRLDQELDLIRKGGNFASYYVLASKITNKCDEMGQPHSLRGCGGGSLVANLMGITETNPLPPHYHCRICGRVEFADETQVSSGFDLNNGKGERVCPDCGSIMTGEGQIIPCEFFLGYDGDKHPDFDINIPREIRQVIVSCLEGIFGNGKVYYAGTLSKVFCYPLVVNAVNWLCSQKGYDLSHEQREKLSQRISNVVLEEGKHPGCFVIVPRDREIYDFCPLGYSKREELMEGEKPATRVDHHELPLETIHVLSNSMLSQLKQMEYHSGVLVKDADIRQINISAFFKLHDFTGLPFVTTPYVKTMLEVIHPSTFSDLLKIYGFSCGTDVWEDNAKELLEKGHELSDTIAFREDVMQYLVKQGVNRKDAFAIAEKVRKGRAQRGFNADEEYTLKRHNVPSWYIQSMEKIGYLFPKSHAVEYMNNFLRMVWYKLYHPAAFYAAVLSSKDSEK